MDKKSPTVLVVGTGTIGEPLIGLLSGIKDKVGVGEVLFNKHTPRVEDRPKVNGLIKRGAILCVEKEKMEDFAALGLKPKLSKIEAMDQADVVIDCTPGGFGRQNKLDYYQDFEDNTLGFVAQGSERGFGFPYARGINDQALEKGETKYIQVVSCNTHNIAAIISTLCPAKKINEKTEWIGLRWGRFICIRRANDISQSSGFVPAPTISEHDDQVFGTHHARDAHDLFLTIGPELNLHSSALKINSQYMHIVHFDILLQEDIDLKEAQERIRENPLVAQTYKRATNLAFSFGRDHGHYGRLLNQTVFVTPSLALPGPGEIKGFCFTPQDGNSLLSSVAATLWLLYPEDYEERLQTLQPYFYDEV